MDIQSASGTRPSLTIGSDRILNSSQVLIVSVNLSFSLVSDVVYILMNVDRIDRSANLKHFIHMECPEISARAGKVGDIAEEVCFKAIK